MRRSLLPVLVTMAVGLMTSQGFGFTNGAPTLECFGCHTAIGEPRTQVRIEGLPQVYKPGATYQVRIVLDSTQTSPGPVQGGFAAVVSAGELLVTDPAHTQLSDRILTHTQEGATLRSWRLAWKAPKTAGPVEVTVMAAAANGDFSAIGDPSTVEVIHLAPKN